MRQPQVRNISEALCRARCVRRAGGCCSNFAGKSVASAVNLSLTRRGKKPRHVQNTPLLFFGGPTVHPDQSRLRERMEMQFESDERG